MMNNILAEYVGTAILLFLGNGVVANVVLQKTKGHNSGWLVINFGWAMAVFVAVFCTAKYSGAHLNPAVSLAMAIKGNIDWALFSNYVLAQMAGAFTGAALTWFLYIDHFKATDDDEAVRACFCTDPAIRSPFKNLCSEILGTFILILAVLFITAPTQSLGSIDALPVALVVFSIGMSLGGTTGYAINPARDLGPRLAYLLLPLRQKKLADWSYAWIPVVGPMLGSVLAVFVHQIILS